jgi:hypothetical protein
MFTKETFWENITDGDQPAERFRIKLMYNIKLNICVAGCEYVYVYVNYKELA